MPPDTNQYGDVFGGWIMSQVDLAGASAAARRATEPHGHGGSDELCFLKNRSGSAISSLFDARVLKVGKTSITVDVEVYAERLHKDNHKIVKVTEAQLVYVAIGPDGRPQPVDRPAK